MFHNRSVIGNHYEAISFENIIVDIAPAALWLFIFILQYQDALFSVKRRHKLFEWFDTGNVNYQQGAVNRICLNLSRPVYARMPCRSWARACGG